MLNTRMSLLVISILASLVVIPTFTMFSFSQSNNTLPSNLPSTSLSNGSISDESNEDTLIENDTSFASLSRSLAASNQLDDEQTSPPPPPSTESGIKGENNEENGIQ